MTSLSDPDFSVNSADLPGGRPLPLLGDRYQTTHLLGKKAGRQTWRAKDLQTQAKVVVKLLTFSPDFHWDDLKLFEREAETLRSLSHPAIPPYLDSFEFETAQGKGFAIVQGYIDAPSLQQRLKSGYSFTETEVKQLAESLLNILIFLHDRQPAVIHRDLKPSNILLGDRSGNSPGQVYLVDFGSVQTLAAREGGTITVVGTYGYMPPEQFGGRGVPASDLYSLGATLIYLVTGQHPADLPQTDLRLDFQQATNLSPSFTRWLAWMTEPSLSKRPATAQKALTSLKTAQSMPLGDRQTRRLQPFSSKIECPKHRDALELLVASRFVGAPRATSCGTLLFLGFSALLLFPLIAYSLWILCALPFLLISSLFGRTRIQINQDQVWVQRELWGWRLNRFIDAPKRHAWKLTIPPNTNQRQIVLWIGTQTCAVTANSREELEWLAQELSLWLDIPISREYQ
jgi:serine/threonine protein kinase